MMNSLYFALSIFGVLVIIRWFIKNDGGPGTSGLLAMKDDADSLSDDR